ncbi:aminotransferase [Trichlorobacter ammonificans]|uniref:Aminotransferase n=1 Tax=Trichlorobacter ammonificans TaxID=2916410 RepID=A0ABN8HFW8_9BACT|nr:aminotransferase [Trichlorobacter ammonificans]CAH2030325.1 Aminotransferase [Trichlorobacter ammonificans]
MRFTLNDHVRSVREPPIGEVRGWAATRPPEAPELIDLCQAVPDYSPPEELLAYLQQVVRDPLTCRYTPDEGLPEVREAVCARYRRRYRARVDGDHICLTVGASQAFWLSMLVLCHAGDEVILQAPCYFDHPMALGALGVRAVYAPFTEKEQGVPNPAVIERLITPRTRAIVLVTPSNPTGVAIPHGRLSELYFLAQRHRIALVLDETYGDFVEGMPHDLFTLADWHRTLVQVQSFGKTYALTGYRAGLLAAAPEFIRQALKIQDTMAVCQPRITQQALKYGLEHLDAWVEENRLKMSLRNSLFAAEFVKPGNRFRLVAGGGFFAWVKHPFSGRSSRQAAQRLVQEAGIMTLPGEAFGPGLEEYLRLALGNIRESAIAEVVRRFRNVS